MKKAFVLLIILAVLVALTGCFWNDMESNTERSLLGVWGSNHSDIFAVGGLLLGFITHYNGTAWSAMTVPDPTIHATYWSFEDVWGTGPDDVFAVGGAQGEDGSIRGIVYHYDGDEWSDMEGEHPKMLRGVWGTAPNNVWAVGGDEDVG